MAQQIFVSSSKFSAPNFICHIKANTPAFQQIYQSHKNWPEQKKLSHQKCSCRRGLTTWDSCYWKNICVSKLFWNIFGREAANKTLYIIRI